MTSFLHKTLDKMANKITVDDFSCKLDKVSTVTFNDFLIKPNENKKKVNCKIIISNETFEIIKEKVDNTINTFKNDANKSFLNLLQENFFNKISKLNERLKSLAEDLKSNNNILNIDETKIIYISDLFVKIIETYNKSYSKTIKNIYAYNNIIEKFRYNIKNTISANIDQKDKMNVKFEDMKVLVMFKSKLQDYANYKIQSYNMSTKKFEIKHKEDTKIYNVGIDNVCILDNETYETVKCAQ